MNRLEVYGNLNAVAADWDALADTVDAPPFARPGWYAAWLGAFAGAARLELLVLRREGRLVAVLPLLTARGGALRSATNWHTPEYALVAEDRDAADEILTRLLGLKRRQVTLSFLDPPTAQRVRTAAARAGHAVREQLLLETPYVDFTQDRATEILAASSRRRVLARRRRRLQEQGTLRLQVHVGAEPLEELLQAWFAMEAASWKGRQGVDVLAQPQTTHFYREIASWAAARGHLVLAFLCLDDRPLAFQLALDDGRRWYFLRTGYDGGMRAYGPGKLVMAELLERARAAGRQQVVLGGGADRYKQDWSDQVTRYVELRLFAPTFAGRATEFAETRARPVAGAALRRASALRGRRREP